MKGITVCCDGDEKLEEELSQLSAKTKRQTKKSKDNFLSILKLFSSRPISKLQIMRRLEL